MALFSEAASSDGATKDLVAAAATAAFAHGSKSFADVILKKLPVDAPAEAAGKLIQLCTNCDADDAEVLRLYSQYFAGIDLSGDASAEQLVAEACIRSNQVQTLQTMLATADCTKRVALIKHLGA